MNSPLAKLIVSSGEPAGIGPDLCLMIARREWNASLVVVADPALLATRAQEIGLHIVLEPITYEQLPNAPAHVAGKLLVLSPGPLAVECQTGILCAANSQYVMQMLKLCTQACLDRVADAMITAPVHKGIINDSGVVFSGHTELLAELTDAALPVMLLCADDLRVALATTHLPLSQVSSALTYSGLQKTIVVLREGLKLRFGLSNPRISVCGLNPHAGEGGHLGREEIDLIEPALAHLRTKNGWVLHGPLPADTLFTPKHLSQCDAVLAMFHDQGLPVLKYAGFGRAVNVTLGLPIIRTSVDHGTALDLAGSGKCDVGSMVESISLAMRMANNQARLPS